MSSNSSSSSKPRRRPAAKPKTKQEQKINSEIQQRIRLEKEVFKKQESLMQVGVTQEFLTECSKYFQQSHYTDVILERAISRICGYPLCNNNLADIGLTGQKYHISLTKKQVYETKEVENFCSEDCMLSSKLYMLNLDDTPLFMRKHLMQKQSSSTKVAEQPLTVSEKTPEQPVPPEPSNNKADSSPPAHTQKANNNNTQEIEDASPSENSLQLTDILQSNFTTPELSNFGIIYSSLEHWRTRNTLGYLYGPQDESYITAANEQAEQRRNLFSMMVTNQVPHVCRKLAIMPSFVVDDLISLINTFSFRETLPAFTTEQLETIMIILLLVLKQKNSTLKLDRWPSHFKIDKDELKVFLSVFEKPT